MQIQTRRGNCSTLAGKSRGETPFCRTLKIVFSRSHSFIVSCKTLFLGIPPESGSARLGHIPSLPWEPQLPLKSCISLQPPDFEGNCDSLRFSPRFLFCFHCAVLLFAPQMWAARPHLANIFEKLLDQKTFYSPAARSLQPIQKNIF